MEWNIHSAIMIGHEHERSKRNRQDFCAHFIPRQNGQKRYGGIICDGCSAGQYSEVGAALLGTFILNLIKQKDISKPDTFKGFLEKHISRFIHNLPGMSSFTNVNDKVRFIQTFLLTTFIFAVIEDDHLIIGRSGDGVIILNDNIQVIDQQGKPHYIAYREIPGEFFNDAPPKKDDFSLTIHAASSIRRLAIASDGMVPLATSERYSTIFGTRKRQLQRKFNVWQQKEKLFYDDVSCIVFEKTENTLQNTIIGI